MNEYGKDNTTRFLNKSQLAITLFMLANCNAKAFLFLYKEEVYGSMTFDMVYILSSLYCKLNLHKRWSFHNGGGNLNQRSRRLGFKFH